MESQSNINERRMSTIHPPAWLERNQLNTNERRMSTMVPPPWLEKNQNLNTNLTINNPDIISQFDRPRLERASGYDSSDEGLPRKKMPAKSECKSLFLFVFFINHFILEFALRKFLIYIFFSF